MPHVIVEYLFDPPATDALFDESGKRLGPCLQERNIAWVESFVSLDRRRRICVFQSPDADSVRSAFRTANVKIERVWSSDRLAP